MDAGGRRTAGRCSSGTSTAGLKVAVTAGPELSVSAPTQVHDFEKLRVAMWTVLPGGRFFVGLRNENDDEITRYDLVLNRPRS